MCDISIQQITNKLNNRINQLIAREKKRQEHFEITSAIVGFVPQDKSVLK